MEEEISNKTHRMLDFREVLKSKWSTNDTVTICGIEKLKWDELCLAFNTYGVAGSVTEDGYIYINGYYIPYECFEPITTTYDNFDACDLSIMF